MRAFLMAAAVVGIVSAVQDVGIGQDTPVATSPLDGVWMGATVEITGPAPFRNPQRQPSIVIYTRTHYSIHHQGDGGPVPRQPRSPLAPPRDPIRLTDVEKLARYEHWAPLGITAGRYEIKGARVFQYPLVNKDQSSDIIARNAGKEIIPPAGQEFRVDGDTLVLTATSADGKTVTRRTYTRLDTVPPAAKPHPIEGVWRGTTAVVSGAISNAHSRRHPNVFIYRNGYYSIASQDGAFANDPMQARPALAPPRDPDMLTDAEKLARYEHWLPVGGSAGRYEVKGSTLFQYPLVAKNQSADILDRNRTRMLGTVNPNSELQFTNGNNTMVHIARSADGKTVTRRTYVRLE
jgi:hypothetical protein